MELNSGYVRLWNSDKILVLSPHLCTKICVCTCHDWPVKKAIVNMSIRLKGNWKRISRDALSLLGAQNEDFGASSQRLLTKVKLRLRHRLIQKKLFPGHIALNCTDKLFLLVTFQHHLK